MKTLQELLALFNSAKSSLADLLKAQIDGENGDARPLSQETQERISFAYLLRDDIEYLMAQDSPDLQQIFVKLNLMISFIGNVTAATQLYSSYTAGSGIVFLPGIGGTERYATNSIYGITRLSVPALIANAPIAVGDNDPRLGNATEAYQDSIIGASFNSAGQLILEKRNTSTLSTSSSSVLNQVLTAQTAGFWINGDGRIDGTLRLSALTDPSEQPFVIVADANGVLYKRTLAELAGDIDLGTFTANRAIVSDGSGVLTASAVTATEIGYSSGVTSPLQTQINNKQPLDADLTAIAALTANGLLRKTAGTWGMDTNTYLTANQTITLTGPITGSGSTTIATTITNNSIGLGKITAIATSRLLGRSTAGSGNVEELTIGAGLSLSGGALASTITQYTDAMARLAISETITGITYDNTTGVFSLTAGYVIPTTTEETNWNTAYTNRITSLTTTGSSGASTLISNTLNIPTYTLAGLGGQPLATNLTSLSGLTYVSASFVKMTASGTFTLDTNTYITGNQTITLSGDVTGSGTTAITTTIANDAVTFAKIQNVSTGILLGRSTASSGNVEEIAVGSGLVLSAGTLSLGTITAQRAVVTNVSGALEASTTTATQIGYLSTLSSNAQTQIDGKQPLDATLTALAAFGTATPGIMVLSGADTFVTRILEGTSNRITVNNASGSGTNPSIDIASTYAGQSTITTVGTITVGAWNGSSIADGYIVSAANWNEAYDEKINSLGFNTSTGILTGTQQDGGTVTTSLDGRYLLLSGGTLTGYLTLNADPVSNLQAATKAYVDNIATGIKPKGSVAAATTGTLPSYSGATQTLTGTSNGALSAQDGVTLVLGDFLLVKNEAGANEKYNGIYEVTEVGDGSNPYELTRIATANTWSEIVNATIYVAGGSTLQGYTFYQTSPSGGTFGTTAITFVVFSISTVYLEGSGIDITGNTISIATGGIVDSMISASASITLSKLASVTANKVLISDGSGYVSASSVTNTEIGYVSGVTSAIQTQINAKQPLDATLTALAAFNSNGIMVQTAADTFTSRTITGTSNRLDVTNGSGVSGNPTLDISASYVGQASITTLGTIATGTWQGTAVADGYVASASNWNSAYNNMVVSAAFNTSDGVLTLTQQDAGTVTVDLDGRYAIGSAISGTAGKIAKFDTGGASVVDSIISESGSAITIAGATINISGAGSPFIMRKSSVFTGSFYATFKNSVGANIGYWGYGSGGNDKMQVYNDIDEISIGAGTSSLIIGFNGAASSINTTFTATKLIKSGGTSSQFLKADGSVDSNTYLTSNQTITLSGQASGSGTTSISVTLDNTSIIGKVLTGYVSGAGVVSPTDSILQAIQKLNGNIVATAASSITIGSTNIALGGTATSLAGLTSVTSTSFVGALTGNASTATALQTARTINGVSFDGTANITVTAAAGTLTGITLNATVVSSSLTSVGTIGTGTWQGTAIADAYISSASTWNAKIGGSGTNSTLPIFTGSGSIGDSTIVKSANTYIYGTATTGNSIRLATSIYGTNGLFEIYGGTAGVSDGLKVQIGMLDSSSAFLFASTGVAWSIYSGSAVALTLASNQAAIFTSSVTATSFIKSGGTSSQFLKADGSVDTNTYLTTSSAASTYQPLDATLTALAGLNTTAGVLVQTGTDTFTKRTITAGTGISVTDGNGVSGNPTIALDTTAVILNQNASAQTANFWITGDAKVNNKVYIGTNGAYIQEVSVGGVYELQVVDSAGNITVIS